MAGVRWQQIVRSCSRGAARIWIWLGQLPVRAARLAFELTCWLATAILLVGVVRQVLGPTDAKTLAALIAGLLPAAFLGAYGREVASRIKKLGPFELFAVREGAADLEDLSLFREPSEIAPGADGAIHVDKLSPRQRFFFDRADRYLNYLEFSGTEPHLGRQQEVHFELLFKIGRSAHFTGEWTKATYWLHHLEKLSNSRYKPNVVDNYIAMSCIFSVIEKEDGGQDSALTKGLLLEAEQRLSCLSRQQALDYLGYFWLAYVQDDLEYWYEATLSNKAVLARRPRYAPAKYNAAVSYSKMGKYREACAMLEIIEPGDEYAARVLQSAETDDDLWNSVQDPTWQGRMRDAVRRTRSQLLGQS
jgi:hypothetical protein